MGAAKAQPNNVTIAMFVCPSRRDARVARGKRDYGSAATSGIGSASQSIFDPPGRPGADGIAEGVELTMIHDKGTANTLLLSHVWMRPVNYAGGDPTEAGECDVPALDRGAPALGRAGLAESCHVLTVRVDPDAHMKKWQFRLRIC